MLGDRRPRLVTAHHVTRFLARHGIGKKCHGVRQPAVDAVTFARKAQLVPSDRCRTVRAGYAAQTDRITEKSPANSQKRGTQARDASRVCHVYEATSRRSSSHMAATCSTTSSTPSTVLAIYTPGRPSSACAHSFRATT
jgi:hypothetical protein